MFTASSDVREALQRMDAGLEAKFVSIEKSEFLLGQDHAGVLALWDDIALLLADRRQELQRFGTLLDALEANRVRVADVASRSPLAWSLRHVVSPLVLCVSVTPSSPLSLCPPLSTSYPGSRPPQPAEHPCGGAYRHRPHAAPRH